MRRAIQWMPSAAAASIVQVHAGTIGSTRRSAGTSVEGGSGKLPTAFAALLRAVACGDLTPSEANELGKLVEAHVKAIELTDVQARLEALEQSHAGTR